MSEPAAPSLRERLGGKWQIPTLFVAVALLVGSISRLKSVREPESAEPQLAQLAARVEDGFYTSAIEYAQRLTDRPGLPAAQRGEVHRQLARAHYLRAERERRTGPAQARTVQNEYAAAREMGATLTGPDLERLGQSHVWAGEYAVAIQSFQQAVDAYGVSRSTAGGPPAAASVVMDLRRRMIELAKHELAYAPADLYPMVDAFIQDALSDRLESRSHIDRSHDDRSHILPHLQWAVATRNDMLASEGRHEEALAFLDEFQDEFASTPWEDDHEYLVCLALYRLGRYDEAEARLRVLRNLPSGSDELGARTGWLTGRVVLSDPRGGGPQRPQEALSFFREVVNTAPASVYGPASRVGMAEALAALARFDESLEQYRRAVERSQEFTGSPLFSPEMIRASATVVAEDLRRRGLIEAPLHYYEIAAALADERDVALTSEYLQILGDLRAALARSLRVQAEPLSDAEGDGAERRERLLTEARYLYLEAGETFQKLARLNTLNESRSAEAAWRAADFFDQAGDTRRTIAVLEQFASERPENELAPRVLLRLGQARQALGRYAEAVETYRENLRRFPRTLDAGSGLIPLARCYMALGGEDNQRLAEKTLVDHILADSPVFTPVAPEFRDALFLLGELYSSQERVEEAIAVLEEALERYPDDERAERAWFLLASGYRRSALALKQEISKSERASEWPRMRAEMKTRLERAAELFAELVRTFEEASEQHPDALRELTLKQARLYQADCLFELGRYEEAVALYETAAFVYRSEPPALSAYVQVINCRLSLGQFEEARAALRRAQYLLKIMPDGAFEADRAGQSRREWERFLDWLERARLLGSERARR